MSQHSHATMYIYIYTCTRMFAYMYIHVYTCTHGCMDIDTDINSAWTATLPIAGLMVNVWQNEQILSQGWGRHYCPCFFRVLAQLSQSYTIQEHHSRRIASSIHHDHEQSIWTWTSYRCCNKYLFASTWSKHVVLSWLDKPPLSKNVGNMLMLSKYSLATNVDNCLIMFACLHHSMHWRKHKDAKIGYWISRGSGIWTLVHCLTDHRANPLKSKTRPRRENRLQPLFWQAIETIWKKTLKNQVVPFLEPKLVPKMNQNCFSTYGLVKEPNMFPCLEHHPLKPKLVPNMEPVSFLA